MRRRGLALAGPALRRPSRRRLSRGLRHGGLLLQLLRVASSLSERERQHGEDQGGQRAVQAHGDAGEGAGLLADLEGAGGADAVAGDARPRSRGRRSRGCRARSSAASRSPSRGCRSAPRGPRRARGCRRWSRSAPWRSARSPTWPPARRGSRGGAPNAQAMATAEPMAVSEPAKSAATIGRKLRRTASAVAPERQAEGHGGGAEQEVHELRALEIGLVGRAGGDQDDDEQARRRSSPGWRADGGGGGARWRRRPRRRGAWRSARGAASRRDRPRCGRGCRAPVMPAPRRCAAPRCGRCRR